MTSGDVLVAEDADGSGSIDLQEPLGPQLRSFRV